MNNHKNDFIFRNTESISTTDSEMTENNKEKEAALKSSFVAVYKKDSFVCIGYIYKKDFKRVFTLKSCMPEIKLSQKPDYYKDISVKSISSWSEVQTTAATDNFMVIFVSIYI